MSVNNKQAWTVVLAGTGINLTFGILYAWSIFAANLIEKYGWTSTEASLPYTVAIFVFSLLMIPGGRLQDKFGAKIVATFAGIFTGCGLILASFFPTVPGLIVSFGVLAGAGIGLGYSSTTPVAIKWFAPEKKGLITGIVVAGFGLASVYISPLTKFLIANYGIFNSFRILGIGFIVVVVALAQFLKSPETPVVSTSAAGKAAAARRDYTWQEMLKTPQFYQLWLMFAFGALAGLMIIGHLSKIATIQTGTKAGFVLVAMVAIFNSAGRPIAGVISDKLGRSRTMVGLYICQGITLLLFSQLTTFTTVLSGAAVVTFAYGAMLSVYPSAIGDFFGSKNLGINYGILFTAWGFGGVVGPILAGKIVDATGGYGTAYLVAACLCFVAAVIGFMLKPITHEKA